MLIVLIPRQGKMRTPLSHLSWPVPLLSPQSSCIARLTFQFASPITGILWAAGQKAIEPHLSPLVFPIYLWFLKDIKRLCSTKTSYILFFPFLFLTLHFDCTHLPPLPPSSGSPVISAPWFESRTRGLGVEITAHGNGLVIAFLPAWWWRVWVIAPLKPLLGGWLAVEPWSSGVTHWLIRPSSTCQGPPWLHGAS